ncbi:hypothetical protein Glove_25g33 [Diversispora epigaea]|uniref:Uncharacterized protein n=1 Tax=Diversispora epigaea TaxID=1348612 RepID=A0A397JJU7_9GLOM|nr:hypothetical protein Glove_25g33 [Diversispora epigaea]
MSRMQTEAKWDYVRSRDFERRKKEKRSLTKMYNVLSEEIGLSPATLASFYRHQKAPQRTSLDKIEAWLEKENQKITMKTIAIGRSDKEQDNDDAFIDNLFFTILPIIISVIAFADKKNIHIHYGYWVNFFHTVVSSHLLPLVLSIINEFVIEDAPRKINWFIIYMITCTIIKIISRFIHYFVNKSHNPEVSLLNIHSFKDLSGVNRYLIILFDFFYALIYQFVEKFREGRNGDLPWVMNHIQWFIVQLIYYNVLLKCDKNELGLCGGCKRLCGDCENPNPCKIPCCSCKGFQLCDNCKRKIGKVPQYFTKKYSITFKRWPGKNKKQGGLDLANPDERKAVLTALIKIRQYLLK